MTTNTAKLKIIFAGTPEFADVSLRALIDAKYDIIAVYTRQDKPAGRGQKLMASPVKQTALAHHIPVIQPKTLRDLAAQEELAALKPDLMIVAAYGLILPQAVLDIPRLGCINIHGSLLPRWRGAAPIHRAILAGDTTTGITIMQMDAGLDTGAMLYKADCPITSTDTGGSLHDKMAELGADSLLQVLPQLENKLLNAQIQDNTLATYAHKLEKEEAKIDWQQPAAILTNQIRAFNPWPVAHCQIGEQPLRIWQAQALDQQTEAAPGTIVHADKNGIDVATGEGILRLLSLQLSGQKILSVADILNGRAALFAVGKELT